MKLYNVKYSVEYNCTIFVSEEGDIQYPDEEELLYNNVEAQIQDRIAAIDIPEGGDNGSSVVKGSFRSLKTTPKHSNENI